MPYKYMLKASDWALLGLPLTKFSLSVSFIFLKNRQIYKLYGTSAIKDGCYDFNF